MEFYIIGSNKARLSKKFIIESLEFIFKILNSKKTANILSLQSKRPASYYLKKTLTYSHKNSSSKSLASDYSKKTAEKINLLKVKRKKSLTVVFLSKKSIQELNFKFRNKNKPTDILSFAPTEKESLGELALYSDPKRAARLQLTVKEEAFYLLLHGVLHLLGFSHKKEPEASQMYAVHDHIFQQWNQRK